MIHESGSNEAVSNKIPHKDGEVFYLDGPAGLDVRSAGPKLHD